MLHARTVSSGAQLRPVPLLSLIQSEYAEMPGLSVTLRQAARLWNADADECLLALEALVRDGFLRQCRGMYLKSTCGGSLM